MGRILRSMGRGLCAVGCVFDVLLLLVYALAMYTGTFRGVFELLLL